MRADRHHFIARPLLAALLVLGIAAGVARGEPATPPSGSPIPLVFDPPAVDFGVVSPGAKLETDARLINLSDQPVRILRSGTSCGCTVADDLSGRELPPRGSVTFHVVMNVKSGLGEKLERFYVMPDGFGGARAALDLKAEAALPIRIVPPYLDATSATSGAMVVEATDGKPFRVLAAGGRPPSFAEGDGAKQAPASRYTLHWDLADRAAAGAVPWFWVVETDRADAPVVDVRVRHETTRPSQPPGRPFVPRDQRVLVGVVRQGVPVEIVTGVEYAPGHAPEPSTVAASGDRSVIAAELLGADVDGQVIRARVRVTPLAAGPGLLYGMLTLRASGFDVPVVVIGRFAARAPEPAPKPKPPPEAAPGARD